MSDIETRLAQLEERLAGIAPLAFAPPMTIGELHDVPVPGSAIGAAWAEEVSARVIHRFASVIARDAAYPAATAGAGGMSWTNDHGGVLWKSNGTAWVTVTPALVGSIDMWAGAVVPAGYLACDGQAYPRTLYPELFAAIGTTWGATDGPSTFNVPDMAGRTPVGAGAGAGLSARAIGTKFGAESVLLGTGEMPLHNHANGGDTSIQPSHMHTFGNNPTPGVTDGVMLSANAPSTFALLGGTPATGQAVVLYATHTVQPIIIDAAGGHAHNLQGNTQQTGGGGAHTNVQPSAVVQLIIYAGAH